MNSVVTRSFWLATLLPVIVAACGDDGPTAPSATPSIRFVNAIATSNKLDFLVNNVVAGSGITFRSFSGCQQANAATYTIGVVPTGSTTPLITPITLTTVAGQHYTVMLTGTITAPTATVLTDIYAFPKSDRAAVRPFNARPGGPVDMYVTDASSSSLGIANASSVAFNAPREFVNVPAIRTDVVFTSTGSQSTLARTGGFDITSRQVLTVVLGENPGGGGAKTFVVPVCQ